MTETTKDGPVLFETDMRTSASSFEISPLLYISTVALAPTGKPQRKPSIIGAEAFFFKENNLETGNILPITAALLVETISEEMTIYGNREGITETAHTLRASQA